MSDKLLEGVEVEWKTLGEVAIFSNGKGHESEIVENGKFIVVNSKFMSIKSTADEELIYSEYGGSV